MWWFGVGLIGEIAMCGEMANSPRGDGGGLVSRDCQIAGGRG